MAVDTSESFSSAIDEYSASLQGLFESLDGHLRTVVSLAEGGAESRIEEAAERIEGQAGELLAATENLRGYLVEGLETDPGSIEPSDANNRISAAIGGDFLAAHQLLEFVSRAQGEDLGNFLGRSESLLDGAQLRTPLRLGPALAGDVIVGLRGEVAAGRSPLDQAVRDRVVAAGESILNTGGKNVGDAAQLIAGLSLDNWLAGLAVLVGDDLAQKIDAIRDTLSKWFDKLKHWALRFIQAALDKLRDWFGRDRVDSVVKKVKEFVKKQWEDRAGDGVAPTLLGVVFDEAGVVSAAEAILDPLSPEDASTRIEGIDAAVRNHEGKAKWFGLGIDVSRWVGGFVSASSPAGTVVFSGIAVFLLLGSAWLVHDHLDSEVMDFLPNRAVGVVRAARGE